jgi:hypothetical protein
VRVLRDLNCDPGDVGAEWARQERGK